MLQRAIYVLPMLFLLASPIRAGAETSAVSSRLDDFWRQRVKVVHPPLLPRQMAVELASGAHVVLSDSQQHRFPLGLRLALHFDQRWGIELSGEWVLASEREVHGVLAERAPMELREQPRWRTSLSALWSPLLGKVSGGRRVLAFEPYAAFGAGIVGSAAEARANIASAVRPEAMLTFGLRIGRGRWLGRVELRQALRLRPSDDELDYALGVGMLVGVLLGGAR